MNIIIPCRLHGLLICCYVYYCEHHYDEYVRVVMNIFIIMCYVYHVHFDEYLGGCYEYHYNYERTTCVMYIIYPSPPPQL